MWFLTWDSTRRISPRARLILYEMVTHGGDGPFGYWSDGLSFAGDCFERLTPRDIQALVQELVGDWIQLGAQGQVWFSALALERLRALRASPQDLVRWREHIDQCEDEGLRATVTLAVDGILREMPGAKGLVKVWGSPAAAKKSQASAGLVTEVVRLYEEILPELPRALKLTDKRTGLVEQRLRDLEDVRLGGAKTPPEKTALMRKFFQRVSASDFLMGRTDGSWRPDLEWLMRPTNFIKVLEGRYDNKVSDVAPAHYSAAFAQFMREYPNPVDVSRAWRTWVELGLDERLDTVLLCVQEDRLRYGARRPMPAPWQYLRDQPWMLHQT